MKRINRKYLCAIGLLCLMAGVYACKKDPAVIPVEELLPEEDEEYSGGKDNTTFDFSTNAFSLASPKLVGTDELFFFVGNSFFKQNWVSAPASTTARDGLGPTFNARSCAACHLKDGRGMPPTMPGELSTGILMRISIAGLDAHGGPNPDPNYGDQLNDQANPGIGAEGQIAITYSDINGTFSDGQAYTLQSPSYSIANLSYGPLGAGIMMSPRVGQQVVGMGLLEAISENDILSQADEADINGDGISGKANFVWDEKNQKTSLGRFGWKANQPSLLQQTAGALLGDLGITTPLFPNQNCTGIQTGCATAADGGQPEMPEDDLQKLVVYISNLSVPARRKHSDENVLQGKKLFTEIGCTSCHTPTYITGIHPVFGNLSNQKIHPYTDLLLHDMGSALADGRPDFKATGNEWRTPPLWGIGLVHVVNGHTRFLHDGRARNLEEAVLWHGGEAEKSKSKYKSLPKEKRQQLIAFLNSL